MRAQRGKEIISKFKHIALLDVEEPELKTILGEIINYWSDEFRTSITSFSCEALGRQKKIADDIGLIFTLNAAGISMHDDIIDKSFRKGSRLTILGKHGYTRTLLVGDLLITKAWSCINEILRTTKETPVIAQIMEDYGKCCIRMCESEIEATSYIKNFKISVEDFHKILLKKNADIEICMKAGALIANGTKQEIADLAECGKLLGFILSLRNEIKDCFDGNLSHRLNNESLPLPILYAMKNSSDENQKKLKFILQKKVVSSSDVRNLIKICFDTKAFDYVIDLVKQKKEEALMKLQTIKRNTARDVLSLILEDTYSSISSPSI
jgi:octaprenyl-diphosphate synthase